MWRRSFVSREAEQVHMKELKVEVGRTTYISSRHDRPLPPNDGSTRATGEKRKGRGRFRRLDVAPVV